MIASVGLLPTKYCTSVNVYSVSFVQQEQEQEGEGDLRRRKRRKKVMLQGKLYLREVLKSL
jgi:hypothetical protein